MRATIISQSNTAMQVKVNAGGDLGAGAVRLDSTTGAFFTVDDAFEYVDACGIDSVTPSSGQYKTAIDIAGSGLLGGGDSIDSIALADFDVLFIASESDSLIQVVADMSGAATGDIIITANTGAVTTRVDGWGYVAVGAISGASPNSGQVGTEVTIGGPGPMNGGKTIASVLLGGTEVNQIVSYYDVAVEVVVAAADASEYGDIVMYADTGAVISQAGGVDLQRRRRNQLCRPRQRPRRHVGANRWRTASWWRRGRCDGHPCWR